ncbi:MAG: glucokinase [Rickettsiales bacterium]|nr:glucokinase [Rickettsiales bacterium]
MKHLCLVADIGGTNSRYALCHSGSLDLHKPRKLPNCDFATLEDSIAHYLEMVEEHPSRACLAVAGPVTGDSVRLTNIDWTFSQAALRERFHFQRLNVTNDFTALAMAVPHIPPHRIIVNGGQEPIPQQPIAVLGPGTGLGVSGLIWGGKHWVPLQGEGGNTSFSPGNAKEIELLRYAHGHHDYVRAEHFISGSGMGFLHQALAVIEGRVPEILTNDEITRRGLSGESAHCTETLHVFCGMLGSFAGDQALALGARGGVFIGGGVVPILGEFFFKSPFRERFEAKGKFADYVKPIPTYVMLSFTEMALIGAASLLHNSEEYAHVA